MPKVTENGNIMPTPKKEPNIIENFSEANMTK